MNTQSISKIVEENDNFLLVTHTGPDGDAIGSTLGLLNALLESGKTADVYFHEELPVSS